MSALGLLHELYDSMSYPKVSLEESLRNLPGRHILNCAMGWVLCINGPRMYSSSVKEFFDGKADGE